MLVTGGYLDIINLEVRPVNLHRGVRFLWLWNDNIRGIWFLRLRNIL